MAAAAKANYKSSYTNLRTCTIGGAAKNAYHITADGFKALCGTSTKSRSRDHMYGSRRLYVYKERVYNPNCTCVKCAEKAKHYELNNWLIFMESEH